MNEKIAVNDVLADLSTIITLITYTVEHCNDEDLRNTLIDFRTKFDNLHWDTYLIAKEKGYYIPAAPAGAADLEQVKKSVCK